MSISMTEGVLPDIAAESGHIKVAEMLRSDAKLKKRKLEFADIEESFSTYDTHKRSRADDT